MTKVWWSRLWASPMASQYIESDVDGLFMLASLKDAFWCGGGNNSHAAGEIRQQEARFGMTPLDRRRLEWELEKPSEDEQPDEPIEPPRPVIDPRSTMRLVG